MFLIEVKNQFVRPNIEGFFIDTDYNPKVLATKIGTIVALPIGISDEYEYDIKLEVGDTIVFNHTTCQNVNRYKDNQFFCEYFSIFAKIEGGAIIPLEKTLFCLPFKEPNRNIGGIEITGEISKEKCVLFEASALAKKDGLQKGDFIYFTKGADYEIEIGGVKFYKMHLRNIIGIERDGVLMAYKNRMMVQNTTKLGSVGGIEKIYYQTSLQNGVVVDGGNTGVPKGSLVTYLNGIASHVRWNGFDYSFIEDRNVKYYL
jgi:co-chaperonin GroES (HSP10)